VSPSLFGIHSASNPYMGFIATGFHGSPTQSASPGDTLTFPTDGTSNGGIVVGVRSNGEYDLQLVPNTGGTIQSLDMATNWLVSSVAYLQFHPASGYVLNLPTGATNLAQWWYAGTPVLRIGINGVSLNSGPTLISTSTNNSQVVTVAPGTRVFGLTTLSLGTVTVSTTAACTPGSTCIYKLTRCASNSSTAVGVPTVGTVTVGTSFVINSESATNTVATGDLASVCWQIN
jgi:hypothetical protein